MNKQTVIKANIRKLIKLAIKDKQRGRPDWNAPLLLKGLYVPQSTKAWELNYVFDSLAPHIPNQVFAKILRAARRRNCFLTLKDLTEWGIQTRCGLNEVPFRPIKKDEVKMEINEFWKTNQISA